MESLSNGYEAHSYGARARLMSQRPGLPAISTFVIRIWHDWSLSGPRWVGRIEHLQSGRSRAFHELEEATDFIFAHGALSPGQGHDRDQASSGE